MLNTVVTDLGSIERGIYDAADFDTFFRSSSREALESYVLGEMDQVDVLSLDVFDTVLLRDTRSELERFHDVAVEFARRSRETVRDFSVDPLDCLTARLLAATNAYQLSPEKDGCREGRLDDIIVNTLDQLSLDPVPFLALWTESELHVEASQLSLSEFAVHIMNAAVASGKRVVLVSDMYLTSDQIVELLSRCGADLSGVAKVFSSADETLNKRSGTIFPFLCSALEVAPERILHIGDSLKADFEMPRLNGLRALHLPIPRKVLDQRIDSHEAFLNKHFPDGAKLLPIAPPAL